MTNQIYDEAKYQAILATLNLSTDDVRAILVMSNSTCDTERDKQTLAGFTTLDHCDAAGYAPVALTSKTVARDFSTNHRAIFDAADTTFANLAAGTRQVKGMLLIKWTGTLNGSIPIAYFDNPGFPFWGNGSSMTAQWNASGIAAWT